MKKLLIITGFILITCAAVTVVVLPGILGEKPNGNIGSETGITVPATSANETVYILKDYNGQIAVFEQGKTEPFKITDALTANLPQVDQDDIRQGITLNGKKELNRALEDYCS